VSRTNDVHSEIWSSEDFLDLTPHSKLLFFWSFTNAECGMAGVYRIARRQMAGATGLGVDEVIAALGELEVARFALYAEGTMFVRSRVKHLRTKSVQIAKSITTTLARLPEAHPIRRAFLVEYANFPWEALTEGLKALQNEGSREPPGGSLSLNEAPGASGNLVEVPRQGQRLRQEVVVQSYDSDRRARIAEGIAAGAYHPRLLDVLDVLDEVKAAKPAFQVEELAIDSACKAKPDGDHVVAAHAVASWVHAGTARRLIASSLLASALDQQRETDAKVKAAGEQPARPAPFASSRRLSAADDLARREQAAAEQLAREAAERGAA
jgi:hypothetical protein